MIFSYFLLFNMCIIFFFEFDTTGGVCELLCASDVKDNSLVDPGIFQQGARYIFFRSGDWFDGHAPWHIPYAFVVRVENKIQIVNITCWFQ